MDLARGTRESASRVCSTMYMVRTYEPSGGRASIRWWQDPFWVANEAGKAGRPPPLTMQCSHRNPHSLPPTCGSGFLVRTAMATGVVNGLVGSIVGIRVPEMSSSSAPSNGGVHEEPDGQGSRSSTVHVGQVSRLRERPPRDTRCSPSVGMCPPQPAFLQQPLKVCKVFWCFLVRHGAHVRFAFCAVEGWQRRAERGRMSTLPGYKLGQVHLAKLRSGKARVPC